MEIIALCIYEKNLIGFVVILEINVVDKKMSISIIVSMVMFGLVPIISFAVFLFHSCLSQFLSLSTVHVFPSTSQLSLLSFLLVLET